MATVRMPTVLSELIYDFGPELADLGADSRFAFHGVPGVADANTDVIACSGVTMTGHQNGRSLHPSVSLPF